MSRTSIYWFLYEKYDIFNDIDIDQLFFHLKNTWSNIQLNLQFGNEFIAVPDSKYQANFLNKKLRFGTIPWLHKFTFPFQTHIFSFSSHQKVVPSINFYKTYQHDYFNKTSPFFPFTCCFNLRTLYWSKKER